jgi:AcrR family transcriptional regulator
MTKSERTRQFIIEKSAPIFNRKGIAGTAMSDILDATQLAKGSLYVHFENKEELSYAAVDYNLASLVNKVMAAVDKQKTAKAKLFAYLDVFADPLNPPVTGGCPMLNFGMEADDNDPVVRTKVNAVIEGAQQSIVALVKMGIASGEFRKSWEAREFATKMFALIEGGVMMCRIAKNTKSMRVIIRGLKKEIEEQTL